MLEKIKKSQISIFVVIGAILIIVVAFLFLNSQFQFFINKETALSNQVSEIVELCVEESAQRGVFLLGFQGGVIEVDELTRADPTRHVDLGLEIPNWDTQRGEIPTIFSMEQELNSFVAENSVSCISNNLASLENNLEINYNESEFELFSSINKENVAIEATYPIRFSEINGEEEYNVRDYYINLEETRLGDLYDLALQIYQVEASSYLFEELTLDQIYSASDYSDREHSMPSEGMSISCTPQVWTYQQLKRTLANLNNNNFKYLHFQGTQSIEDLFESNLNEEYESQDLQDYYRKNYVYSLPNTKPSFSSYQVDVTMPSVEMTGREGFLQRYPFREFEVSPSSGEVVKPVNLEVSGGKIPVPCIQIYQHRYTLDYDLMIKVTDTNEDGENFFFQYPLRVDIESNNPKTRAASVISTQPVTATNELFCSEEEKIYPVNIFAKDITNDEFLSDVNISYDCISLSCDIGQTQKPTFRGVIRQGAIPSLEAEFPYCIGGEVNAQKEGYHQKPNELPLSTTDELIERDPVYTYDVELIPTREFKIDDGTFLAIMRETQEGRRVITEDDGYFYINVENQGLEFETFAIWPNEGNGYFDKIELLDMEDVKYNLSVYYLGPNDEFRGFIVQENVTIDARSGDTLEVTVPASTSEITQEDYLEFMEYMQTVVEGPFYGVRLI